MDLTKGQRVTVLSGPPDHGAFDGVVESVDAVKVIVTPDEPALRAWFTHGYDIGRAHWGQAVIPI